MPTKGLMYIHILLSLLKNDAILVKISSTFTYNKIFNIEAHTYFIKNQIESFIWKIRHRSGSQSFRGMMPEE